jgi:hypothetical protein
VRPLVVPDERGRHNHNEAENTLKYSRNSLRETPPFCVQGRLRASDTKPTKIGCRKYFAKNLYSNGVAFHQKLSYQKLPNNN